MISLELVQKQLIQPIRAIIEVLCNVLIDSPAPLQGGQTLTEQSCNVQKMGKLGPLQL